MKNYFLIALAVLAFSFTNCGSDEETTPSAPTNDEIIGTYSGTQTAKNIDDFILWDILFNPEPSNVKIIISKKGSDYVLSVDATDPTTSLKSLVISLSDISVISDDIVFQIPSQNYPDPYFPFKVQGSRYVDNNNTSFAGVFNRSTKTLNFECSGVVDYKIRFESYDVFFAIEYNAIKQ
jgi:hypothetical protein